MYLINYRIPHLGRNCNVAVGLVIHYPLYQLRIVLPLQLNYTTPPRFTSPDILSTVNLAYPDLLIGGPGFEFPILRLNGKMYDIYKKVKDKDLEKLKKTSLEELSKIYHQGIK